MPIVVIGEGWEGRGDRRGRDEKRLPKKRLPEGWLLSTSGSAPRLESRKSRDRLQALQTCRIDPRNAGDYTFASKRCQSDKTARRENLARHNPLWSEGLSAARLGPV